MDFIDVHLLGRDVQLGGLAGIRLTLLGIDKLLKLVGEKVMADDVLVVVLHHLDQQLAEPGLRVDYVDFSLRGDFHHDEWEIHAVIARNGEEGRVGGQVALLNELLHVLAVGACERDAAVGDVEGR